MFLFRLARELGKTVHELERSLGSRELAEWMAYDSIDPIGEVRGDLRAALISSTMANIHRSTKTRAYKLADFLLIKDPEPDLPIDAQIKNFRAGFSKLIRKKES